MPETPDNGRKTERLAFRCDPVTAEKIRALADVEDVPYSDLLREKAAELCAKHDRIMERASAA